MVCLLAGCSNREKRLHTEILPPGWVESNLEVDGLTRWYRLYLPDPLPESPVLILYLHGGTLSMRSIFSRLAGGTQDWLSLASREGLILLVPNGVNAETGDTYGNQQTWNDLRPDTAADQTSVDDVGFILALLDQISTDFRFEPDRIFVTGASNGGMMTYRLLIEKPERFTAGAAFIANLPAPVENLPQITRPIPIMIANGTADPLMPWDGGMIGRDRGLVLSTAETVHWWVTQNLTDPARSISTSLLDTNEGDDCRIQREIFPAGIQGAPVWFYSMVGGGHTIPSVENPGLDNLLTRIVLGPVCRDADGVSLAWDFFINYAEYLP